MVVLFLHHLAEVHRLIHLDQVEAQQEVVVLLRLRQQVEAQQEVVLQLPVEVAVLFQMVAAVRLLDPDATIRIRGCTCRSCNAFREVDHMIVVGLVGIAR